MSTTQAASGERDVTGYQTFGGTNSSPAGSQLEQPPSC